MLSIFRVNTNITKKFLKVALKSAKAIFNDSRREKQNRFPT